MLTIRKEQMRALDQVANEAFCQRLIGMLRAQVADRLPASQHDLEHSVKGWVADARLWGLMTEHRISGYVLSRARATGKRDPLEERLQVYLQMYRPDLTRGMDVPAFAHAVVGFAIKHRVREEEGVTWLAVILLSARTKGWCEVRWVEDILGRAGVAEEARLLEVHREAERRGWIVSGKRT